jgi:hypothetical protein
MADNSPPLYAGGLSHFDLPTIFRCAVELAEAAAGLTETEWADLPANCEGPTSPIFERQMEASRRLRRIEEETERLKRSLGATGPLGHADGEKDGGPKWDSYDQQFNNTIHDRIARLALTKLATAAIDLSGFATWREWQWQMRETGLRLLAWGLAQLWEGMSGEERSRVRDRLPRTHKAIGWPADPATDPPFYDGPEEIPFSDQYRIVSNYISCYRDYPDDVQKEFNRRAEQGQVKFLRQATLGQFVEAAERAAQALQAMVKRNFDTPQEWGDLYTKAFWPLACLRRANEIQPREAWPPDALEQRKLLAHAAGILLTCVGGTPEAKATCKPEDANKAFEDFTQAILRLRVIADPKATKSRSECAGDQSIERLLAGPADVDLSPRDMALLEAHLRQPVSFATIQQEKKETGRSSTEAARNKLKLIRDFNRALQAQGEADEPEKQSDPAPAVVQAEAPLAAAPGSNSSLALMRVFTNEIADDRIVKAIRLLADDKLTANEKLTKIDALIPFPATASAEQLGEMLGVTKQAVLKTGWWIENRKGEKENEVGRRREGLRKRAKRYESLGQDDDNE